MIRSFHLAMTRRHWSRRFASLILGSWASSACTVHRSIRPPAQEDLNAALDRLSRRVYAEQGIPMLLCGENLAPDLPHSVLPPPVSAPNTAIALEYHTVLRDLEHRRTAFNASDSAAIVEWLAERDFYQGGHWKQISTKKPIPDSNAIATLLSTKPLIRAINFHNTPRSRIREYRAQLEQCRRYFSPVTENDLDLYLQSGRWHKSKPGMILGLYEGYRNHYDVFLPLLEEYGFVGWFFVITGFVGSPPGEQMNFAGDHDISIVDQEYADGRFALSWDEIRKISRKHVVASHARTHTELSTLSTADRQSEILGSQQDFRNYLGHPVKTFVSYAGPAFGNSSETDSFIREARYRFVVSNHRFQRL